MSDADGDATRDDEGAEDEDRSAILQRRRQFVAIALGGLALAGTALVQGACAPCLAPIYDGGPTDGAGIRDAEPQPCLRMQNPDVPNFYPDAAADPEAGPDAND